MTPPIDNLGSNASAVVDAGRRALRPPAGSRERLEALLESRISAFAAAPVSPEAGLLHDPRLHFALAFALALGSIAGVRALRSRFDDQPAPKAQAASLSAAPPPAVASPSSSSELASAPPSPERKIEAVARPATPSAPRPVKDELAKEVALLSAATSDLRAGVPERALKLLDDHGRQFPNGALAIERYAARAQALCLLNHVSEGRAELANLAPQSPAAWRAKQVCDAAAAASGQ